MWTCCLVDVLLTGVAHVPNLRYHLFSLPNPMKNGHAFDGLSTEITVGLKPESSISFPLSGTMFSLCGYRVDSSCRENDCAVLAPGQPPNKSAMDINTSTAPLDTITRFYSARPWRSKGSSYRGSCRTSDSRCLPPANAGGRKAEMIGSSQGCAVDDSTPVGRAESETNGSSQGGAVDASSAPVRRADRETRRSSQGGAVDDYSAPAGRAESETRGSPQGDAVHASSAPAGRAEIEASVSPQGGAVNASLAPEVRADSETSCSSQGGAVDAFSVDAFSVPIGITFRRRRRER